MTTAVDRYIQLLEDTARSLGRNVKPLRPGQVAARFTEDDAALFEIGLNEGLLRIDGRGYLHSLDPHQTTAWLVEGNPAWPCWEYLPHAAAYVELITRRGFPLESVRFETPGHEHGLDADLAIVSPQGQVLVLGEAKKESRELDRLLAALTTYSAADPGAPGKDAGGGKAAWKLAHRLWKTAASWLWLVGPGDRRAFSIQYRPLRLEPTTDLPAPAQLALGAYGDGHPRIQVPVPTPVTESGEPSPGPVDGPPPITAPSTTEAATSRDEAPSVAVAVRFDWEAAGAVMLDRKGKLAFPQTHSAPGVYRLMFTSGAGQQRVYVGEAIDLRRRMRNYRTPGVTQQTSQRIHALLRGQLTTGGHVSLSVAHRAQIARGESWQVADLADKHVRRLAESAAVTSEAAEGLHNR